jgi:hypothetical protein
MGNSAESYNQNSPGLFSYSDAYSNGIARYLKKPPRPNGTYTSTLGSTFPV